MPLVNFGLGGNNTHFPQQNVAPFYEQMIKTVVTITNQELETCTGVLISENQILAIYRYVKDDNDKIIQLSDGRVYSASTSRFEGNADLAILMFDPNNVINDAEVDVISYAGLPEEEVFIGQEVHTIGLSGHCRVEFNSGYVSLPELRFEDILFPSNSDTSYHGSYPVMILGGLQLDHSELGPPNPYGSPMFDSEGHLVGLFFYCDSRGMHYCIPSQVIKAFIGYN